MMLRVDVYSACEEVELLLNGVSLGRKPAGKEEKHIAAFEVPYETGTLEAIGYTGGVAVAGRVNPTAGDSVSFAVSGPGTLAAVGSADPTSTEPYRGGRRRVFRGRCLAVVAANGTPGEIRLRAEAARLEAAEATIRAAQRQYATAGMMRAQSINRTEPYGTYGFENVFPCSPGF